MPTCDWSPKAVSYPPTGEVVVPLICLKTKAPLAPSNIQAKQLS